MRGFSLALPLVLGFVFFHGAGPSRRSRRGPDDAVTAAARGTPRRAPRLTKPRAAYADAIQREFEAGLLFFFFVFFLMIPRNRPAVAVNRLAQSNREPGSPGENPRRPCHFYRNYLALSPGRRATPRPEDRGPHSGSLICRSLRRKRTAAAGPPPNQAIPPAASRPSPPG